VLSCIKEKGNKIYHEAIHVDGDEGMKVIEKVNEKSYKLVKSYCEKGAELQSLEDRELFYEFMDWKRCLIIFLVHPPALADIQQWIREQLRGREERES